MLFTLPINVGELDLLAHEISLVPRSSSPGDTASENYGTTGSRAWRYRHSALTFRRSGAISLLLASPHVGRAGL